MLLQVGRCLDIALTHHFALRHDGSVLLYIASFLPIGEHQAYIILTDSLVGTHQLCFLAGEDFGQQVEQVLGSLAFEGFRVGLFLMTDGIAEELHLAPEVVLQ